MTSTRNQPLTTDDIARLAPSALAREASDGMSQRYTYIPVSAGEKASHFRWFKPEPVIHQRRPLLARTR